MIPKILLPFNIIKALINAGLILILFQPLSSAIKQNQALSSLVKISETATVSEEGRAKQKIQTVLVYIFAAAVVVISFIILFTVLQGQISIFDFLKSE